ncbi:FadR family transcriptional regulator [Rhodococcus sp. BP-252]|uniref:GntR family transcriptional regulator n=1 Tax=Rhodococcoides kyotonense TaxID=398843 RepID=A0A177YPS7_9NOCA|nr:MULTISPECIES: FCD domain-containing protein [Rhodococcus]MBY6411467.1 FadR family transcriptional regulator [Rhodococcus sp. BP-320]MBY6416126.1 FadR family transcriptional regulator [Rhodococcus sp. BP-321]MBY6423550.1 FadR family transcriptional regulator [Rhodococcus sp. BP-324]MBY6426333.1 FadR family transcriptional regulator [Rhodococcus sp. BP-323]MBY6431126.1 FadR family transcriptional regulator [Rhodococcus sp. BP-322]
MTTEDHRHRMGRPQKMSERVANVIADEILGGGIVAGQRLPTEKEMVAEYGVARTTVREALRLLESRDLVTIKAGIGGGPVACRPKFESLGNTMKLFLQLEGANISDVIDVRLTLEPIVARQATSSITDAQLDTMQAALDSMREAPEDYENFQEKNALFQTSIYKAAGNPAFRIVMETLWLLVRDAEPNEHPIATRKAATEAQQAVLDAMRERDADAAAAAMSDFVHDTARYYRKRLSAIISQPVHWQL